MEQRDFAIPRLHVLNEILETERNYVNDLRIIVEVFMRPILAQKVLPLHKITTIFANVEAIMLANADLLERLEKRMMGSFGTTGNRTSERSFTSSVDIGDIFSSLSERLKVYTPYCVNYQKANECVTQCIAEHPPFASFLEECYRKPEVNLLELRDFLVKPIQRICKYPLLFRELLKVTPATHTDYPMIQRSLVALEGVASHINHSRKDAENLESLAVLEGSIAGLPKTMRLAVSRRKLIRDSVLIKIQPNGAKRPLERHFFLFSDMILYTSVKKGVRNQYQYKGDIPVEVILLNNVEDSADTERVHGFELVRMDIPGKLYWLYASSADEKAEWMTAISDAINEADAEQRALHMRNYEQYQKNASSGKQRSAFFGVVTGPVGGLGGSSLGLSVISAPSNMLRPRPSVRRDEGNDAILRQLREELHQERKAREMLEIKVEGMQRIIDQLYVNAFGRPTTPRPSSEDRARGSDSVSPRIDVVDSSSQDTGKGLPLALAKGMLLPIASIGEGEDVIHNLALSPRALPGTEHRARARLAIGSRTPGVLGLSRSHCELPSRENRSET